MQFLRQAAFAAVFTICAAGAVEAVAGVLIDRGPAGTTYEFTTQSGPHTQFVSSQYGFQEFFVRGELGQDSIVRGMTVTSNSDGFAPLGTQMVLSIFADEGGAMGDVIAQRTGAIDGVVDLPWTFVDRPGNVILAHASFADVGLAAGAYWFSMSTVMPADVGWVPFKEEGAPKERYDQAQLNYGVYEPGDTEFHDHTSLYRLPYLIDGAVPEPSTWALLMAGFGLTGAALRRRGLVRQS